MGLSLLLQISLSLVETLGGRRRRRDNRPVFLQVTVLVHRGDCEGTVHEQTALASNHVDLLVQLALLGGHVDPGLDPNR